MAWLIEATHSSLARERVDGSFALRRLQPYYDIALRPLGTTLKRNAVAVGIDNDTADFLYGCGAQGVKPPQVVPGPDASCCSKLVYRAQSCIEGVSQWSRQVGRYLASRSSRALESIMSATDANALLGRGRMLVLTTGQAWRLLSVARARQRAAIEA